MSGKEAVQQVVDALPDEATLDDAIHALYLRAMLDRAEDDIREGRVLSHEQAKKRLGVGATHRPAGRCVLRRS